MSGSLHSYKVSWYLFIGKLKMRKFDDFLEKTGIERSNGFDFYFKNYIFNNIDLDYKKLLDRTVLYRPQSKYIDFAFDVNLNNPFVRKNFSENIPSDIFNQLTDERKKLLGLNSCPPKDEFTRITRLSENYEWKKGYELPKAS